MYVYIVQPGDTIESIAAQYDMSVDQLIQDNELANAYSLVPGQSVTIAYPEQAYIVQEGDTIPGIANIFGIPQMQLLRNNPFLAGRDYINPGERLVISYGTTREITTNGYAYPYINMNTLRKTLPYLTYLSIFNYTVTTRGDIRAYFDDTDIIRLALEYGTIPLMVGTTLTPLGEQNLEAAYELLLNEAYQEQSINNIIAILNEKGYYGLNVIVNNLNNSNQGIYESFLTKVSARLFDEGYLFFITINPEVNYAEGNISFQQVDYSRLQPLVSGIIFMNLDWGSNYGPPLPVTSFNAIQNHLNYAINQVTPDTTSIGLEIIGYDWELPFTPGTSRANAVTWGSAVTLAHHMGVPIQFDETTQSPFIEYQELEFGIEVAHVVWFVNGITISAQVDLVEEYGLGGIAVWNIMIYSAQLWQIINSRFNIVKYLPVL